MTEDDLPEWGKGYTIKMKNGEFYERMGYNTFQPKNWWLDNVEWYLQPVEEELYPKSFINWILYEVIHPDASGQWNASYQPGEVYLIDGQSSCTIEEAFEYWQTNIKDK